MRTGRTKWLFRLGVSVVITAALWAVWIRFLPRESRGDEATFGQFFLALIGMVTATLSSVKGRSDRRRRHG